MGVFAVALDEQFPKDTNHAKACGNGYDHDREIYEEHKRHHHPSANISVAIDADVTFKLPFIDDEPKLKSHVAKANDEATDDVDQIASKYDGCSRRNEH